MTSIVRSLAAPGPAAPVSAARCNARLRAAVLGCIFLAACATRGTEPDTPQNAARLGFLGSPVARHEVEARLGRPSATYESGRVVSYLVYMHDGGLTTEGRLHADRFELMLEYGPDDRVVRRALVRVP